MCTVCIFVCRAYWGECLRFCVYILFRQILVQEAKRDFSFSAFDCIAMGTPFLFVVHEMRFLAKQTVPPFVPSSIPFTIHVQCKCVCVH